MSNFVPEFKATIAKTEPTEKTVKVEPLDDPFDKQEIATPDYNEDPTYKRFISNFLDAEVAVALMQLIASGAVTSDEIDNRIVDMFKTFRNPQAVFIANALRDSEMYGVQNKPQYITSVLRSFRDRTHQMGAQLAIQSPLIYGPEIEKVKELLDRTGYSLEVTVGQRKYYNPPKLEEPERGSPIAGHEVYIGQIPKNLYEDTIVPLFETCGTIYRMRLMMDPVTGRSRGYAFLTYVEVTAPLEAVKKFNGHEISPGKALKVNVSVANTRLFIGNIPKSKCKNEILAELKKHTDGVVDCLIYGSADADESRKNRGFCFIDFIDHKSASDARRRIGSGKIRPWNSELIIEWAEQQEEPDDETMATVKVVYVRNLKESITENRIIGLFSAFGDVERVKKIRDYAFVHYAERESALKAIESMNGSELAGVQIDVALAKPLGDKRRSRIQPVRGIRRGQEMRSGAARSRMTNVHYGREHAGFSGGMLHSGIEHGSGYYGPKQYDSSVREKYPTAPRSYNQPVYGSYGSSYSGTYRHEDHSYGYGGSEKFGSSAPVGGGYGVLPESYGIAPSMYGESYNAGYAYDDYSYGYGTRFGAYDVQAYNTEACAYAVDSNPHPSYRGYSSDIHGGMSSHGGFYGGNAPFRGSGSYGLKRPIESSVYPAGPPTKRAFNPNAHHF